MRHCDLKEAQEADTDTSENMGSSSEDVGNLGTTVESTP